MDLAGLRIFKAVAETGGITKAAARLHRVPSNVTTRVRQLEESLGTALFHRHKRRLTLSAEGKLLLAYAERLLRLSSEAQAALRSGAPRGTLRLGSLESTAATRLPQVLSPYHAIIACAAAGSGVAVVPRSVIRAVRRDKELRIQPLPQALARARTLLVWRKGHKSTALDALQAEVRRSPARRRRLPAAPQN